MRVIVDIPDRDANGPGSALIAMIDDPAAIEQIEARLQRGWELIENAEAAADEQAVSRFTRHWLQLLEDYERMAGPRQSPREHESRH